MSKADFLAQTLNFEEYTFNGKSCFLKEMDAQEFASVHDVIRQTFSGRNLQNETVLDVLFKSFVVCIALHDEDKKRVFDPTEQADIESVASVKFSELDETYKQAMRVSNMHGFIGEEPVKKMEA